MTPMEQEQRAVCTKYSAEYLPSVESDKAGFALSTKGLIPVNGLRHPPENGTSGWYIWCGEEFSEAADFFVPIHTSHIYEDFPEIAKYLGLPAGYRFLLAGYSVDVWFDESLLKI
jgi:hypothetical protein